MTARRVAFQRGRRGARVAAALLAAGATVAFPAACGPAAGERGSQAALARLDTAGLAARIRDLAADSMEGRSPASLGEARTLRYLRAAFETLGLRPGNGESWFQEVPLVSIESEPSTELRVAGRGVPLTLRHRDEFVAVTSRAQESAALAGSEVVFAGYGVVAPEYGWSDYEGIDVRGKTVIVLVNDPGFAAGDSALFGGRRMTYYGRWTYKYEEAARQGAAAAFIVHQSAPAGYPWEVVRSGWSGSRFALAEQGTEPRLELEGWVTEASARRIFGKAGLDFDSVAAAAARPGFQPLSLGLAASVALRNALAPSATRNVLARLPGSARPEEHVLYVAHWDHLGKDASLTGDSIFNGARDNASGTAGLLELAEAFASLDPPPARSLLFLAVGAEEHGLLGSAHYANNPVVPASRVVAVVNLDQVNIWGPTRDITVIGYGNSELDDLIAAAAAEEGRVVRPDPEPEKGFFYRSDHFSFAKAGVPALYTKEGIENLEHGEAWARERLAEWTAERYHKPGDEIDSNWDLRGAVDDLRLLFRLGLGLADGSAWPNWREENEFRSRRDSTMRDARP